MSIVPGDKVTDHVALSYVWGPSKPEEHCKHEEDGDGEIVAAKFPKGDPPMYATRNSKHLLLSHPCQVFRDVAELVRKLGSVTSGLTSIVSGPGPAKGRFKSAKWTVSTKELF
jgi:hypothetical protein